MIFLKQQDIFESKIIGLKDRLIRYKLEIKELREGLEDENQKAKYRKDEVGMNI